MAEGAPHTDFNRALTARSLNRRGFSVGSMLNAKERLTRLVELAANPDPEARDKMIAELTAFLAD